MRCASLPRMSNTNTAAQAAYISRAQLAVRLGVSVRTVATMIANRQLPVVRLRGRTLFSIAAVDDFLARTATIPAVA
jgi:excisionase family DNA binding protein